MDVKKFACNRLDESYAASDILTAVPAIAQALINAITDHQDADHAPIALLLERGLNLAAAEFSALSLGRFFLPIDPGNPIDRINTILEDSTAAIVVVDAATQHRADQLGGFKIVNIDEIENTPTEPNTPQHIDDLIALQPDDVAYMIYTSGSTGRPKGVPIHWAALDNHNRWFIDEFNITADDRCSQLISPGFDVSIQDIFPVIRGGASVFPASSELLADPHDFFRWVETNQLTLLSFPTALWHTLVPYLSRYPWPQSVRTVLIGGEQANPQLVGQWFDCVDSSKVRLVNLYGPTEVTIASTYCELVADQPPTIGKPIRNINVHLLDEQNQILNQPNTQGEIVISGVGVAKGYWNRPDLTEQVFFRSDLLDGRWSYRSGDLARYDQQGNLSFMGRADNQVKLRGHRIELNEIQQAVSGHAKIKDAIVRKTSRQRDFLVCFAVPADHVKISNEQLKKDLIDDLRDQLPSYMIPAVVKIVDRFPLTVGGKVDVQSMLKSLAQPSTRSDEPLAGLSAATATMRRVARVWQQVLGDAPAGIDTSFQQSGGDSLSAMSLVLELETEFELTGMGLVTLAVHDTVHSLATYIDELAGTPQNGSKRPAITFLPTTESQPIPQSVILFHPAGGGGYLYHDLLNDQLRKKHSVLVVESPYLTGELPVGEKPTIAELAEQYYPVVSQHLAAGQEVITAGYSFGGLMAWEVGRLLKQNGYRVRRVVNIDQPVPAEVDSCGLGKRLSNWMFRLKHPRTTYQDFKRIQAISEVRAADRRDEPVGSIELLRSARIEDFYRAIEQAYQPTADELEMILIQGEIFEAKIGLPDGYGWTAFATSLKCIRIAGSHSTIFHKRFVRRLREAFIAALE